MSTHTPEGAVAAAAALLLLAAVVAAAAKSSPSARTASSSNLHFAMPSGDIDHLDPGLWYFASTWKLSLATCTPLLTYPDAAGSAGKVVIGGIASMPKISNGGRTYTFQIKPGLKFPNGKPINAAVEKATFDRLFGKKLASPAVGFFNVIVGSQAVADGKATSVSGIKASGNTLTINLTQPVGSFLKRMTVPWTCPVPLGSPAGATENGSLLVSGPYVVSKYVTDRTLVLTKNPAYNAKELGQRGHFDTITFDIGVDASQAELQIKAGQLDGYLDRLPSASRQPGSQRPVAEGPHLPEPDAVGDLPLAEQHGQAVRQPEGAPGGQLRDQPQRDPARVGRPEPGPDHRRRSCRRRWAATATCRSIPRPATRRRRRRCSSRPA